MSATDLEKHVIYTSLTLNSTTLFTYENYQLIHRVNNLNCSEIVSQELGLINASKTLVGSIVVTTSSSVTQSNLTLYFMKKLQTNLDGSNDLLTVIAIANVHINKLLVLSILKKIMDKYISFKLQIENETKSDANNSGNNVADAKTKLSKFKPHMYQIIKFEEMNYETNNHAYKYGTTAANRQNQSLRYTDEESTSPYDADIIGPNQLLLASEEIEEVRQLMLDNINKVIGRGDKLSNLVDQTDRLTSSSLLFQRRVLTIKRDMWLSNAKFILMFVVAGVIFLYLLIASQCGFPFFGKCLN